MKALGEIRDNTPAEVSVAPGTTNVPTDIVTFWMLPGTYLIEATARFTLPKQSQCEIHVASSDGKNSVASIIQTLPQGIQWLKNTGALKITGSISKQVCLRVRQDSGSAIACIGYLKAIRIN